MTLQKLIPAWRKWGKGIGDMYRIRKSVLKNISLPEETKQFLNQGGIIDTIYGGTPTLGLPHLTELASLTGSLPASFARYRVLGDIGYLMFQCLDEEGEGGVFVVMVNPKTEPEVIFVNSSILKYAEICVAAQEIWDAIEQDHAYSPSPTRDQYIAKYAQTIRQIDPIALADEQNWYSRRLVQLQTGVY